MSKLNAHKLCINQAEAGELMVAIEYFRFRYRKLKTWEESGIATNEQLADLAYVERKGKELAAEYDSKEVLPTIHTMAFENEDQLLEDLSDLLLDLDQSFNIGKGLSVPQIDQLCVSLMQRMGSLTLEDIALCFYKAKCGDYGQVYDRLDLNVINGWLNQYLNDRKTMIMDAQQNKHLGSKEGMSYDPADRASLVRVANDRGINSDDESHYQAFRSEVLSKQKPQEG